MKIALAQLNPTVGDLEGNAKLILDAVRHAEERNSDLILFSELVLTGYPPEDLLFKPSFIDDNLAALRELAARINKIAAVVGFVDRRKDGALANAAAWIEKGRVAAVYHKICLPNYSVFDEQRYFKEGSAALVRQFQGLKVGVTICEDIWVPDIGLKELRRKKPDLVLNLSSSPFNYGKLRDRQKVLEAAARTAGAPIIYANTVGGQDELVFDGGSFVVAADGRVAARFPQFESGTFLIELERQKKKIIFKTDRPGPYPEPASEIYGALVLGLHDYVLKNKFKMVALGLSGGIDSSLVAALAVDALGADRVIGVTMPSRFNLPETRQDAAALAKNLGIRLMEIPIQPIYEPYLGALAPVFAGSTPGLAEENLQSRIRGSLLMALSNKFDWLILTTGNKSEISTGYCTLYGDTAGGFAVLKDVLKTRVYELAAHVNARAGREIIPPSAIQRAPTAELKENQKDADVLGPYEDLDPIIVEYVENNRPMSELLKRWPDKAGYVEKIVRLIDRNEYKRRQAAPGVKITPRAFGRDHRMPITNLYSSSLSTSFNRSRISPEAGSKRPAKR